MLFLSVVWPLWIVLSALTSSGVAEEQPAEKVVQQPIEAVFDGEKDGTDKSLSPKESSSSKRVEKKRTPSLSKVDVLKWLRTVPTAPSDNQWIRVLMEGTHRSLSKHGREFVTNCSLLGDCTIELAPPYEGSTLSEHGGSMFAIGSLLVNHENRSVGRIIEDRSSAQNIGVQEAQLLYLWRRTCDNDHYLNTSLKFKWRLVEKHPRDVVRMAFKRDFSSQEVGKEVDFTILPFQLPDPCDDSPVRTQFDLSITLTRTMSKEAKPTGDTPKPSHELLEAFPSVIKMIAADNDDEAAREIFSHEMVGNNWEISSEEIRERWLNPDVHKSGKIVILLRQPPTQPLTVHIAYCVRGERW
jgi:hypothetical protein